MSSLTSPGEWTANDWTALGTWATVIAAGVAVYFAARFGGRQVEIASRQATIAERLAAMEQARDERASKPIVRFVGVESEFRPGHGHEWQRLDSKEVVDFRASAGGQLLPEMARHWLTVANAGSGPAMRGLISVGRRDGWDLGHFPITVMMSGQTMTVEARRPETMPLTEWVRIWELDELYVEGGWCLDADGRRHGVRFPYEEP